MLSFSFCNKFFPDRPHAGRTMGPMTFYAALLAGMAMLGAAAAHAADPPAGKKLPPHVRTQLGSPTGSLLNINNITMWASSNGMLERRPDQTAGVTFPRGTTTSVFAGGFLWGGIVRDSGATRVRVGGQTYNIGTVPGRIVRPGVSENPANADVRIFRVRRDWATADLRQDAAEVLGKNISNVTEDDIDAVRRQYQKDWVEWPWEKGAPYYDRNGIPGYQPDPTGRVDSVTDEPGLGNADEVIWFVANDLDPAATSQLYGSPPIGLEMQVTCWAYARPQMQNVIFQRCRLIYKGLQNTPPNAVIDSMYMGKWVDPDIGDYSDDYAGCSPSRSVGYAYNSAATDTKYTDYGLVPPVIGYDLLQGPRVPRAGGKGHWNLTPVTGSVNLPMTSFTYFTIDTRTTDFAGGTPASTSAWWNLLRGYKASPLNPPACMTNPLTNECTSYELNGDPVNLEGWLDGKVDPAGDRRFFMSSGPFSLALGDTQEVVVALIGAIGSNNRDGVTQMFTTDDNVQDLFNLDFQPPDPVPVPDLQIVELNDTLMLDWERDTAQVSRVEKYNSRGYAFESYRIYQFWAPSGDLTSAYAFPPFDVYTLPRFMPVATDYLRNRPLVNGQLYYYAVTAVMVSQDPTLAHPRLESPIAVKTGTPHTPNPGVVYPYAPDAPVENAVNFIGVNDASVNVEYYDPTRPDNHIYKVLFYVSSNQQQQLDFKPSWSLIDSTTNDTLVRNVFVDQPPQRVITRGMNVQVLGVPYYMRDVVEITSTNPLVKTEVFNHPNPGGNYMVMSGGNSVLDTLKSGTVIDADVDLRFTGDSSWTVFPGNLPRRSKWVRVPFSAWWLHVIGRDTIYQQLYTFVSDFGSDSIWRANVPMSLQYQGHNLKGFYPVTILIDSFQYSSTQWLPGVYNDQVPFGPDSFLVKAYIWNNSFLRDRYSVIWKAYIVDLDSNGVAAPPGTVIRFERYHQIHNNDQKLFFPKGVQTQNLDAARKEVGRINVFPNPYYARNRAEVNTANRFVKFSHLPYHAVIRIFNLAGTLVRTVRKDDPSQFVTWDLNNETGLPIAGGLYLAHLTLSDAAGNSLGEKILKLMVVREDQLFEN